jgi:transposase InsO family protein
LVALFRYGVIAPVAERPVAERPVAERPVAQREEGRGVVALVREVAGCEHHLPGVGPVRVGERTVYAWLRAWRAGGIAALRPLVRRDRGTSRALTEEVIARASRLREEQPRRTTTTLIDLLVREGRVPSPAPFHRATLDRHLRRRGKSRRHLRALATTTKIKMRFSDFGEMWVGDYHHGPLVRTPAGGVATAKLGAFLDHATRYPVADRYYLSEDLPTLRDTLLRALLVFGAPKLAYVDNGSVYRADQLAYSLARVGCRLVHSKPYYSEGRGVIERWWQMAGAFEDEVRLRAELLTLHEINVLWEAWREERYCRAVHGDLGRTPAAAIAEVPRRPLEPALVRELFLVGEQRVVHEKDGCVSVMGRRFLCDSALRGERVDVRYDPCELTSVLILVEGHKIQTAFPQPLNAPPERAKEPQRPPASVDYLALVRRDYDARLLEHTKPLAYAELRLEEGFDAERFVAALADLAGLELRAPERRALTSFWKSFGPLPEDLVRIGVEHAVRMHGRGRAVEIYLAAVRTLVLAHWRGAKEQR